MSTTEPPLRPQPAFATEDGRPPPPKPPQGPSVYFPLGYKDAAYQWWSRVTPSMAENKVLAFVPHLREAVAGASATTPIPAATPDPFGSRIWRRSSVHLSGKNRHLNEICVERVGERVDETLVMVHGYGAGLGFFYQNLEPVSRIPGLRLYALDMLGMGNSSRPPFKIYAKDKEQQVIEAENWFIDALEEWRKARKIERFTLLGHSLGGYLAVSYAIKYPGRLNKLILASPVGVPEDPYAVSASMPEPQDSTLQNEFTQDQQSTTEATATTTTATQPDKTKEAAAAAAATTTQPNARKRPLPSWLVWLWDANISPFSIVRMTGPLGPRFISGWSSRRFNHLPPDEAQALHDYSFSIFKQKGSGEYALAYILAPGAYARRPIINRIHQVGRQVISPTPSADDNTSDGNTSSSDTSSNNSSAVATPSTRSTENITNPITNPTNPLPSKKETGIPIVFMYGENDWMDVAGGLAAEQKLKTARAEALRTATEQEMRDERGTARVVVVPKAGHHLYLDNPDYFNQVLREEMEDTMRLGTTATTAATATATFSGER